jgi:hypothetical protein
VSFTAQAVKLSRWDRKWRLSAWWR